MKHWIWGWLFAIAPLDSLPQIHSLPFSTLLCISGETAPCEWYHIGPHAHWRVRPVGFFGRILESRKREKVAVCCCPSCLPLTLASIPTPIPLAPSSFYKDNFYWTLLLVPRLQLSLVGKLGSLYLEA